MVVVDMGSNENNGTGMMIMVCMSCFIVLLSVGVIWYGNREGWFDNLFEKDEEETDPPKETPEENEETQTGAMSGRRVYIYAPESCKDGVWQYNGNTIKLLHLFLSSRLNDPDNDKDYITLNYTDEDVHNVWTLSSAGETDTYYIVNSEGHFMGVDRDVENDDLPDDDRMRITLKTKKFNSCKWIIHDNQGNDENMYTIQSAMFTDHYIIRDDNLCDVGHRVLLAKKPYNPSQKRIDDENYLWNIEDESQVDPEQLLKGYGYYIEPIDAIYDTGS